MIQVADRQIKTEGRFIRLGRLDGENYRFIEEPSALLDGLRKSGGGVDLFTFVQRVSEPEPRWSYPIEMDNFAVLPISTYDKWWNDQIGFKARNKAKQATKKGVVIRELPFNETLVHGMWKIYNETPVRQGRKFPHYGKNLDTVRREAATFPDCSVYLGAFLDDKLIGFIKLTYDERMSQAGLMHIISMIEHRDKAPTNALIAEAVRACATRGIGNLVYSHFSYGNKLRDSLAEFKERNGFKRVDVPRYYVPLTKSGWLAYRLGLHRKFIDYCPESVLAKLREFRKVWYGRRFQMATEL